MRRSQLPTAQRIQRRARRLRQVLLGIFLVGTMVSVTLLAACIKNDMYIDRRGNVAIATVDRVTTMKTIVSYRDSSGDYHTPRRGLIYPGGLAPGQRVWVEYDSHDTNLVRVQGRDWRLALWPITSVWLTITAMIALLWYGVNRRESKRLKMYPDATEGS